MIAGAMDALRRLAFLLLPIAVVACADFDRWEEAPKPEAGLKARTRDERPVIHFGVVTRNNPIIMFRDYQPMMDYLSAHTPYRFELKLGKTYRDAVRFLGEGETDMAYLGGVTYLMAHAGFGALPLVKPLNEDGEPFSRSVFVVRQGSGLERLTDLQGRSLALGPGYSTAGNLIPCYEIARAGLRLEELQRFAYLPYNELIARRVLEGAFDAGAVDEEMAHEYRDQGLRPLFVSEPIPSAPLSVRPDLSDSVAQAVVEALLALPVDRERRAEEFRYGFVPAADEDYEPLRQKLNTLPEGCSQGCHRQRRF